MARPANVPDTLRRGPFHVREASAAGVTHSSLRGSAYTRLFPRVWVWVGHEMTDADWREAARLCLPDDARTTGPTRIQQLGLDIGAPRPLHFVVARDLHRDIDGLMLHRTDRMPVHDDVGVHPAAAFVELCRQVSVLDAVAAGDWLLREGHMTTAIVLELCRREPWREGTLEAAWVTSLLDERSMSPQESRVRVLFDFAGLPRAEVNRAIVVDGRVVMIPDWWWPAWRVTAEYEGGHHQVNRDQYLVDIDRYQLTRDLGLDYQQITRELYGTPVRMVTAVHRRLVAGGYPGPAPTFGARFRSAFTSVALARVAWRSAGWRRAA